VVRVSTLATTHHFCGGHYPDGSIFLLRFIVWARRRRWRCTGRGSGLGVQRIFAWLWQHCSWLGGYCPKEMVLRTATPTLPRYFSGGVCTAWSWRWTGSYEHDSEAIYQDAAVLWTTSDSLPRCSGLLPAHFRGVLY